MSWRFTVRFEDPSGRTLCSLYAKSCDPVEVVHSMLVQWMEEAFDKVRRDKLVNYEAELYAYAALRCVQSFASFKGFDFQRLDAEGKHADDAEFLVMPFLPTDGSAVGTADFGVTLFKH